MAGTIFGKLGLLGHDVVIRAVIANPGITEETIDSLIEAVILHGKEILSSIPANY